MQQCEGMFWTDKYHSHSKMQQFKLCRYKNCKMLRYANTKTTTFKMAVSELTHQNKVRKIIKRARWCSYITVLLSKLERKAWLSIKTVSSYIFFLKRRVACAVFLQPKSACICIEQVLNQTIESTRNIERQELSVMVIRWSCTLFSRI